jgi:hypothetical protein
MERRLARADLRVGDADRQRVVAELQRHYIEGRLTSEELGERVSQALHARTFADFTPLLADLPPLEEPNATPNLGHPPGQDWHTQIVSPPIGAILLLLGVLALLWVLMTPGLRFGGFFFPWPLLIWGFFILGGPRRGRRF